MFIKTHFDEGYINGTLGVVEDFDNSGLPARQAGGADCPDIFRPENFQDSGGVDSGRRREGFGKGGAIAVKVPAWAITVHKSQGMSFWMRRKLIFLERLCRDSGMRRFLRLAQSGWLDARGFNDMALAMHPRR